MKNRKSPTPRFWSRRRAFLVMLASGFFTAGVSFSYTPRLVYLGTGFALMVGPEPVELELVAHYDIPADEIGSPRGAQRVVLMSKEPLPVVLDWKPAVTMGGAFANGQQFLNIDGWGTLIIYPFDPKVRARNIEGRARRARGPQGVILVEQNEDTVYRVLPLGGNGYEIEIWGDAEFARRSQ